MDAWIFRYLGRKQQDMECSHAISSLLMNARVFHDSYISDQSVAIVAA